MHTCPRDSSKGFALLAALLLLLLLSAIAVGLIYMVTSESRIGGMDRENTLAYYGAEAGMEKMMADLNLLYASVQAPTVAQIQALGAPAFQPVLPNVAYPEYVFTVPNVGGVPNSVTRNITTGPNEGLLAQIVPMTLTVTARRPGGQEVKMSRSIEVALIPVFQFGIFSDTDLSYFPGPGFDFGGRVHTNGNLFLASSNAATGLIFHGKITAVNEVIRAELSNTLGTVATGRTAAVWVPRAPLGCDGAAPACRDLQENEGSKTGGPASGDNAAWPNISTTTYNGMILDGTTGARPLTLPFVAPGLRPIELIRRPPPAGDPPLVAQSRLHNTAQIRVLISDRQVDLPTPGVRLANVGPYFDGVNFGATNTAFAEGRDDIMEPGLTAQDFVAPPNTLPLAPLGLCAPPQNGNLGCWPLIDGFLLVQRRDGAGNYVDVTMEWLNLGIARENPNAILKFQAFRDYTGDGATDVPALGNNDPLKFYPINLYDTREGEWRDVPFGSDAADATCAVGGIMNVVELDVLNLRRWLLGTIGATGNLTENVSQNGYILYFSDRRGQRDPAGNARGFYGFEDIVDPAAANGEGGAAPLNPIVPNNVLDPPEDVNANGALETFGAVNIGEGFGVVNGNPSRRVQCKVPSAVGAFGGPGGPGDDRARKNRVSGARHGIKLVNGALGNLPSRPDGTGGFTVASENSVYIQGNYNASPADPTWLDAGRWAGGLHVPAAVIADAVMFMSVNWTDRRSFQSPTRMSTAAPGTQRLALTSWYRVAIASGKNISWPWPAWAGGQQDYGLDGGTHNFLRYLERWSGQTFNYRGSLVSLYYAEYANGIYKCCDTVYSPPTRNYSFDLDFLNPNTLPPGTPTFRDVVNLGYQQVFTPN